MAKNPASVTCWRTCIWTTTVNYNTTLVQKYTKDQFGVEIQSGRALQLERATADDLRLVSLPTWAPILIPSLG